MKDLKQAGFFFVLAVSIIVCLIIFFGRLLPSDVFAWDEGHHALYGSMLTTDIKNWDWDSFWQHTHRQTYWPFFHSWLLTVFFLFFGKSYAVARSLSLTLFFSTALLTYLIALRTDEKDGWIAGIAASFLCLTSPLLVALSVMNMIELLGTVLFVLSAYLYFKSIEQTVKWRALVCYSALGVVLGVSMVTKYNYALNLIPGVLLVLFIDFISEARSVKKAAAPQEIRPSKKKFIKPEEKDSLKKALTRFNSNPLFFILLKYGLVIFFLLLITVSWFTSYDMQNKISMVFWTEQAHSHLGAKDVLVQNLYYPSVMIDFFTFSRWLGVAILASILGSLFFYRTNRAVRSISIMFLASLFVSTFLIPHRMARLLIMEIPWALVIFCALVLFLVRRILSYEGRTKMALICLLVMAFLPVALDLRAVPEILCGKTRLVEMPTFDGKIYPEKLSDILDFYRQNIPKDGQISTLVTVSSNISPYAFMFHFNDWGAPVLTQFNANMPEFSQSRYFPTLFPISSEAVIFSDKIFPQDLTRFNDFLESNRRLGYLESTAEKDFTSLGVKAVIYRRKI